MQFIKTFRLAVSVSFVLGVLLLLSCRKQVPESDDSAEAERNKGESGRELAWPVFRGTSDLRGFSHVSIPDVVRLKWRFETGGPVSSSPVISDGRVFFGSSDGHVYALNLDDGARLWAFDTGSPLEAPPLIIGDLLFIGDSAGVLHALRCVDGTPEWVYRGADGKIAGSANFAETTAGTLLLFGCYDNHVYALMAKTGGLHWRFKTDDFINGAPAIDGERVVFGGCDGLLHVLGLGNGKSLKAVPVGSYVASSAALADGRAYVGHYDGKVVCVGLDSGEILWEYEDGESAAAFFSSPALGDELLIVGARNNTLYALEREGGNLRWRFRAKKNIDSSPVICRDKVLAASLDGRIYLLNLSNGRELWSYDIGYPINSSPAVVDGYFVFGAEDGQIYAFGW